MNAQISVITEDRLTKFGMEVLVYQTQLKLLLNLKFHAQRLRKLYKYI